MGSKKRIRSYIPHLAPFWKATAYFFLLYYSNESCESGWCHAISKLLPMMALITFTVLHGSSLHGNDVYGSRYSKLILLGLASSAIGDVILVWKENYLILGIIAFSLAHIMYTIAFGFERPYWTIGAFLGVFAIIFWKAVTRYIKGIMVKAVLVYALIISTMLWRAIARFDRMLDLKTSWTLLSSCVGAIFFTISDCCIAGSMFLSEFPMSHPIIMATYYLGQLGIAWSVVDCQSKQRGMNLKRLMKKSTMLFRLRVDQEDEVAKEEFAELRFDVDLVRSSSHSILVGSELPSSARYSKSEGVLPSDDKRRAVSVSFAQKRDPIRSDLNETKSIATVRWTPETISRTHSSVEFTAPTEKDDASTLETASSICDSLTRTVAAGVAESLKSKCSAATICTSYSSRRKL